MHPSQTWSVFLADLQQDILPLYLHHEQTFDRWSVHGRMHICRAVLFAEFMLRYYHQHTALRPDPFAIRYAIAFHDSGREGNGWDRWEHVSARLCREYLEDRLGSPAARAVGELIDKDIPGEWGLEKRIVQDADVLEIMRVTSLLGFLKSELRFLGPRDATGIRNPQVRAALIAEAWRFIRVTEKRKPMLMASENPLQEMLNILAEPQVACPMLRESLCVSTS